jgi:hypothetical protein
MRTNHKTTKAKSNFGTEEKLKPKFFLRPEITFCLCVFVVTKHTVFIDFDCAWCRI